MAVKKAFDFTSFVLTNKLLNLPLKFPSFLLNLFTVNFVFASGYRDAELGWVEIREESVERNADHYRLAQFLIIYAPRRGILEVSQCYHGYVGKVWSVMLITTGSVTFLYSDILKMSCIHESYIQYKDTLKLSITFMFHVY